MTVVSSGGAAAVAGALAFAAFMDAGDPAYMRASPSFGAPYGAFWARPVPELDPGRKVSEQDCTSPWIFPGQHPLQVAASAEVFRVRIAGRSPIAQRAAARSDRGGCRPAGVDRVFRLAIRGPGSTGAAAVRDDEHWARRRRVPHIRPSLPRAPRTVRRGPDPQAVERFLENLRDSHSGATVCRSRWCRAGLPRRRKRLES